jgi:hypothetical protein
MSLSQRAPSPAVIPRKTQICSFDVTIVSLQQQLRQQGSASAAGVNLLVKPRCLPDHSADKPCRQTLTQASQPFLSLLGEAKPYR